MLIYAWRARLAFHDLVQKVFSTIERTNLECDAVLIENKASGHSLAQELKRLMRPGQFALHLLDPKRDGGGDKVSRMYAVQPSFAAKLIYAPTEMTWCRSVIDEVSAFPKGKYDDQADTVSQAINWLRKRGLARMPFEHEEDIRPKPFMGQSPPIYDV
jgi:predicted phage terminase large subunit-like protein